MEKDDVVVQSSTYFPEGISGPLLLLCDSEQLNVQFCLYEAATYKRLVAVILTRVITGIHVFLTSGPPIFCSLAKKLLAYFFF